jgi:hypothetical protein
MNHSYKELLPAGFAGESRVWIYQCNRPFTVAEALEIDGILNEFVQTWHSHGDPVKGWGHLFLGQFIILMADETGAGVSGCSTDSSVRVIKEIERRFEVRLFDRIMLAFMVNDRIELLPMSRLSYALEKGTMNEDSLYINNTIRSKAELEKKWIIPIKDSWLADKIRGRKTLYSSD